LLNLLDRQIQRQVSSTLSQLGSAQFEIALHELNAKCLPLALVHDHTVSARLPICERIRCSTRRVVVTHNAQRKLSVSVAAVLLCKKVEVQFTISRVRITLQDLDVLLVQACHGPASSWLFYFLLILPTSSSPARCSIRCQSFSAART
jgi:hypothetical protein